MTVLYYTYICVIDAVEDLHFVATAILGIVFAMMASLLSPEEARLVYLVAHMAIICIAEIAVLRLRDFSPEFVRFCLLAILWSGALAHMGYVDQDVAFLI